jgi:predicted Zn-dependent peptidase
MTAEQVDGVRAVTAEDVMGVAHATFTAANRTVSRVVPRA